MGEGIGGILVGTLSPRRPARFMFRWLGGVIAFEHRGYTLLKVCYEWGVVTFV